MPEPVAIWPAFLLRSLAQRVTVICDGLVDEWGVTLREFGVLTAISATSGQSQQALGGQLGIDRTTIVGLIDHLEGLGLLERRRRADDRRSYGLYLSTKGRRALPAMERVVSRLHDHFLSPLSSTERHQLTELLTVLLLSLDGPVT